jgi:hypothetical protein
MYMAEFLKQETCSGGSTTDPNQVHAAGQIIVDISSLVMDQQSAFHSVQGRVSKASIVLLKDNQWPEASPYSRTNPF